MVKPIFTQEFPTLAQECLTHDPKLYDKLLAKKEIKSVQKLINKSADRATAENNSEDFEQIRKNWTSMLEQMEMEIKIQMNDPEILHSGEGFPYPYEEFYIPFKNEVLRLLEKGETPDVGIVGYGSLGSKKSTAETFDDEIRREWVLTRDIQRGLFLKHYSTHDTRLDDFWAKTGVYRHDESGEMAIRYKKGQLMSCVRMSGLNIEEIQNLRDREFCYFMLPIGHAWTPPDENGEESKVYKLNLAVWPIGRTLTKKHRGKLREKWISHPRHQRDERSEEGIKDMIMFETAHTLHLNGLKADIHYTETCLDIGDTEQEEIFLDTTFVPVESGEPITLREFLSTFAPANNPEKREYFGERLNKKIYKWDDNTQKFILTGTVRIKTTDPQRQKSWHKPYEETT